MPPTDAKPTGILGDISEHVAAIFRHMLPGVLVVGTAWIAYPNWFAALDLNSSQHLIVLAVVTTAVGNTWFALNRYGLHQLVDYLLYLIGSNGPAIGKVRWAYLDDLGKYTFKSLHTADTAARAKEHVRFRAATALLALTLGEVLALVYFYPPSVGQLATHHERVGIAAALALGVGFWQMIIARRIDYYVVNPHAV
jgi:hypothetical protein